MPLFIVLDCDSPFALSYPTQVLNRTHMFHFIHFLWNIFHTVYLNFNCVDNGEQDCIKLTTFSKN